MLYDVLRFIHVTGIIMLVGNITATAIWKFFADRTGDPAIIAFGQRLVTLTDWSLTFWGILLTMAGGYGAVWIGDIDPFGPTWLVWSQVLFVAAGLVWMGILLPLQIRMARAARGFAKAATVPETYRRDSHRWFFWGLIGTAPLIAALWLMIAKPY